MYEQQSLYFLKFALKNLSIHLLILNSQHSTPGHLTSCQMPSRDCFNCRQPVAVIWKWAGAVLALASILLFCISKLLAGVSISQTEGECLSSSPSEAAVLNGPSPACLPCCAGLTAGKSSVVQRRTKVRLEYAPLMHSVCLP